uniref:Uncharacterized protein n=1 Tax=Sphaerodactylus townsendi TaxID=933632 RepID=A0ACB8F2G3_9SAUR
MTTVICSLALFIRSFWELLAFSAQVVYKQQRSFHRPSRGAVSCTQPLPGLAEAPPGQQRPLYTPQSYTARPQNQLRQEVEDKMIAETEHMMSERVNDSPEQRHQMSPPTLGYFSVGPLLQTPSADDLGMACSMVQTQTLSSVESPLAQSHLLRSLEQSSTVQTQTLRNLEKHLNDLKKENFSLKLRIYFLEERMQQKYEATRDDVYRRA